MNKNSILRDDSAITLEKANRMNITLPKLYDKGISQVHTWFDSHASSQIMLSLMMKGYSRTQAEPFTVYFEGIDSEHQQFGVFGLAEGVLHKETDSLALDDDYKSCRCVLYLHKLFVEEEYRRCGVASAILNALPKLLHEEYKALPDAIVLAVAPQFKDSDGKIKQITDDIEFIKQAVGLVSFYRKNNFIACTQPFMMGKKINQEN